MNRLELADAVRRVRRTADLSQRELADVAQVSKSLIAAVESCAQSPTVEALQRILAVGPYYLVILDPSLEPIEEIWPWRSLDLRDRAVRDFMRREYPDEF